jgi:hypothetical protein
MLTDNDKAVPDSETMHAIPRMQLTMKRLRVSTKVAAHDDDDDDKAKESDDDPQADKANDSEALIYYDAGIHLEELTSTPP